MSAKTMGFVAHGWFPPVVISGFDSDQAKAQKALDEHKATRPDHLALKLRNRQEQKDWSAWCTRKFQLEADLEMAMRGFSPNVKDALEPEPKTVASRLRDMVYNLQTHVEVAQTAQTRQVWQKAADRIYATRDRIKSHVKKHGLEMPCLPTAPKFKDDEK
jgi:transcriptional regulator with GAF, ATPase, and Fis domain